MRFGFHFLDFTIPGSPESIAPMLRDTAVAAEEVGATWFTVMDHWFQMEAYRTSYDEMLEGYTTLGYLAAVTKRMQLGTMVTGVTYRHPGLLVKTATTLDVLSEGRGFLGIGAAWYEREHLALGVPFPPLRERFERLEETLQIAQQMWSDDNGPFNGVHYQLAETISVPQPFQREDGSRRMPIVIGGSGERKTLRMVAQYADATNLQAPDAEVLAHKLDVLRGHCDALGRDYDSILKTVQGGAMNPIDDPDGFLRMAEAYAALGVEHIHLRAPAPDPVGYVRAFGDTLAEKVAAIPVGR
jgi:F420-dependent oxidoreductase-like protein